MCGRTLLRGENAEVYLDGGSRRSVCELCKSRALHEGWVREGTMPTYDSGEATSNRRGSLLSRLRRRRESPPGGTVEEQMAEPPSPDRVEEPAAPPRPPRKRTREPGREPRHVRAVPMGAGQKIASAIEVFNNSEHRRTVAGVARSLGAPMVSILPNEAHSSRVDIVAAWELCWYRYEVDLSEDAPAVRLAGQGAELDELAPEERAANASFTEQRLLVLGA